VRWRSKIDSRSVERNVELGTVGFAGHAAVFNTRTWIGSRDFGFWEEVDASAFNKTLADGADVRFLVNHNPDLLLGRTVANTLRLTVDERGLKAEADLPAVSYADDLAVLLERGDVTQMSFAFEPIAWRTSTADDGKPLITLTEVRLWDVSAVTYPAYEQTDAGLRGAAFNVLTRSLGFGPEETANFLRSVSEGAEPDLTLSTLPAETTRKESGSEPATATLEPSPTLSEDLEPEDKLRLLRFRVLANSLEK
jgi:HK97 family phage prohead protease